MSDLGSKLKQTREKLNITLEEISSRTNIKVNLLELIEKGDFCALPSFVHARGFIKKYAEVLGIKLSDIDELLMLECPKEKFVKFHQYSDEHSKSSISPRGIKLILAGFLLFLVCLAVFFYLNNSKKISDTTENPPVYNLNTNVTDNKSDNVSGTAVIPDNKTEEPAKITTVILPTELSKKSEPKEEPKILPDKKIMFSFSDICWVHMSVDNSSEYDFIAEKGLNKSVNVKEFFKIDIGNAKAITIRYGDQIFENFGKHKEPVKGLYFYFDNGTFNFKKIK